MASSEPEPSSIAYRKTDALGRQVWDKNFFAAKALARQYDGEDPGVDFLLKESKYQKPVAPPVERRALQHRTEAVVLDADVGKARVVTSATPRPQQGGFWCDVCSCLMKDSQSYLDHINGKKHNRQLGMTMRVEKVDADRIRDKLRDARLERAKKQEREALGELGGVELRLSEAAERERQRKKEKKEKKKKKKKRHREDAGSDDEALNIANPFELLENGVNPFDAVESSGNPEQGQQSSTAHPGEHDSNSAGDCADQHSSLAENRFSVATASDQPFERTEATGCEQLLEATQTEDARQSSDASSAHVSSNQSVLTPSLVTLTSSSNGHTAFSDTVTEPTPLKKLRTSD